ncbi:sorting nexin-20 isoform X3 [Notothenia coriiceps]|uniref:Sorting nexin-20 isoform X3 n=1 Tax=Notothenia coriiceps TaxID=8208 RepID=A0A6I9PHV0_9TELE|nr:PREDICTED: sorting nexin-20-like isoform X3 [Notothenia coriiceps]
MAETNLMSAASALTTKQLQQKLSSEKKSEHPVLLLFEIPSTRVVENQLSKYVVYEVVVMLSGSFDSRRVSVERRYSDFLRLQRLLLQEFDSALEDVSPPPKLLSGNFCAAVLLQRRLALQDYLAKLFSTRCVRRSPLFAAFFTDAEQRGALVLLRGGQFSPALRQLEDVLALQNPQVCFLSPEPELSGLLVCFPSQCMCCRRSCSAGRVPPSACQRSVPWLSVTATCSSIRRRWMRLRGRCLLPGAAACGATGQRCCAS